MRQEGLTRDLASEVVERIFALGFALEQLRQNFRDLQRCLGEYADTRRPFEITTVNRQVTQQRASQI